MPPEGLDEAREAFAQEIPQATRQRDQGGRFVSTSKPEAIFQPREIEGDDRGDTSDGGPDPRLLEQERRIADGRSEEGDNVPQPKKRAPAPANDNDGSTQDEPPERIGEAPDDADPNSQKPDKGTGPDGEQGEDTSPRYKIQVDGEEREVSLNEALRGYQREETFNTRMRQMVEVAKTIDERGAQAQQAREAYIQLCQNQEQEFAALIPKEPDWEQLYKQDPAAAHQLENNYRAVYGTLNQIRQRREMAQREAYQAHAQQTASYARAEFDKFRAKNKLANQTEVDHAIQGMRRTAAAHGFSEDEIGTTYDERMLSILHKAAKYDRMMANKPFPVQPERQGALQPGSAPRVGNGAQRSMNEAQKRLASTGRVDDAAAVMAQFIRGRQ
jgi:hypothetical protein